MAARRYDLYLLVLKTIFYSLAALVRKILFSPLEDKSHIFAPPCNILYISRGSAMAQRVKYLTAVLVACYGQRHSLPMV
jgi:hypothetical protein